MLENILNIFSMGDIIDKKLVNEIKIENLGSLPVLEKENEKIDLLLQCDYPDLQEETAKISYRLKEVLVRQWDALNVSMDDTNDLNTRSRFAMKAQEINFERVRWKNRINKLYKIPCEVKKYGTKEVREE